MTWKAGAELKIRYSDFWPGFEPENFILTHVVKKLYRNEIEIVTNDREIVDVEIFSSFPFKSTFEKITHRIGFEFSNEIKQEYISRATYGYRTNYPDSSRKRIWFSGENMRPPYWLFDLSLSFDQTDESTRNIYFPYWMARIDWGYGETESEISPRISDLSCSRSLPAKTKSICVFSSNLEPSRQLIINAIEENAKIDKYGSAYGNRVHSKMEVASNYSLQICNENDLYPGYVTEKLQEAWLAGNVPVWSGLLPQSHPFNKNAIIDVTGLTSINITELIRTLSDEEINHKLNQPLLREPATLFDLENAILRLL